MSTPTEQERVTALHCEAAAAYAAAAPQRDTEAIAAQTESATTNAQETAGTK